MPTREEMLRGVVKVNGDEREDSKTTPAGDTPAVRDDAGDRADQQASGRESHGTANPPAVQGAEGSLEEVLARRKAYGAVKVARLTEQIDADVAARQQLKKELKAIDKVSSN